MNYLFNKNLKKLRELHGLSQKNMADLLHIAPTTYRNYENTLREPSYSLLVKIAQALNTTTDYLLDNPARDKKTEQLISKINTLSDDEFIQIDMFVDYLKYKRKKKR